MNCLYTYTQRKRIAAATAVEIPTPVSRGTTAGVFGTLSYVVSHPDLLSAVLRM